MVLQASPEAQFSYQKGERSLMCFTVHSPLASCCPLCTLKRLLSQSSVCRGSSVFKEPYQRVCVREPYKTYFSVVLWDLTVSPHRSGVPKGLRTLTPHPTPSKRKITHMTPSQSVNQSITCNRRVIFYTRSSIECVCRFQKPIFGFRRAYCRNHVCIFPQRCVCCFIPPPPPAVLHQMPWFFYKRWQFEWDSQIFFFFTW